MNEVGLKDQCFGVEVELTGITREQAAQALADYFGTEPRRGDDYYDSWYVRDGEGKEWRLMSDSSIRGEQKVGARYTSTSDPRYRVEMVTPKLTYAELPKFQECVRRVRTAGGKVNSSCGIHIHVDAANHNRQSLKNLIGIMYSKEDILFKALQVNESRASRWCQKVREPMLQKARKLSSEETKNLTQLEAIWYEGDNGSTLLDQVLANMDDLTITEQLKALLEEKQHLQTQIDAAKKEAANRINEDSRMAEYTAYLEEHLNGFPHYDDEIVRKMIERVTVVDEETIRVKFRYSDLEIEQSVC